MEPANANSLRSVLNLHVVARELSIDDLSDGLQLQTVNGQTLTVSRNGSIISINEAAQSDPATVILSGEDSSNGTLFILDRVLLPNNLNLE